MRKLRQKLIDNFPRVTPHCWFSLLGGWILIDISEDLIPTKKGSLYSLPSHSL